MTRPWEETWRVRWDEDAGAAYILTACIDDTLVVNDPDKAALIAQAPAMARLLVRLQWAGSDEEGSQCPSCYATAYGERLYDAAGEYTHCAEGTHADDCELAAVLRASGALP